MTDYAGVTAYGDFELSYSSGAYQTSEQRRYLDGECHETTGGSSAQTYCHGDVIASTFATSDSGGALTDTMAYTAFGERVNLGDGAPPGSFPRYEYAGGYGYESGLISVSGANTNLATMTLQHLGQRWYDPALGRFVQRDPLGVTAGLAPYLYCGSSGTVTTDATGLTDMIDAVPYIDWFLDWILNGKPGIYVGGGICGATAGNYKWRWGIGKACNQGSAAFGGAAAGWAAGKDLDRAFGISECVARFLANNGIVGPGGPGVLDDVGSIISDALGGSWAPIRRGGRANRSMRTGKSSSASVRRSCRRICERPKRSKS